MKKTVFFFLTFSLLSTLAFGQKKTQMPPIQYPADLPDTLKPFFLKQYQQGYTLYTLSCAKCHSPGNKPIPVFTDSQLMNYQMRVSKGHKGVLTERQLSEGELALVITFLNSMKKE
jgi:cytochrome c5